MSSPTEDGPSSPETLSISSADAVVHLEYTSPSALPSREDVAAAHGGGQWTRFVCISDTHCNTYEVPEGDVLLHAGDLTRTGRKSEVQGAVDWLGSLPHKIKVIVAGNHDVPLHRDWYAQDWRRWHRPKEDSKAIHALVAGKKAKAAGIIYLENEKATFRVASHRREWTVHGSPWSPEFHLWAFGYHQGTEAEKIVRAYDSNADMLMTHGPPLNIFDQTTAGDNVGCETLAAHLASGRLRPRLHVFGHIHEAHGAHIHSWDSTGQCAAPEVQNDINYPLELTESDSEDEVERVEKVREKTQKNRERAMRMNEDSQRGRTAFVNAATYPQGRNVWREGRRAGHGGPGFRPVVVDLRDVATRTGDQHKG